MDFMSKVIDLTGRKFNRLLVIEFVGLDKNKKAKWKCICNCENKTECTYSAHSLKIGNAKSCGCLKKPGPQECENRIREKLLNNSERKGQCLEWKGYIPTDGYHYGMMYDPTTKKYSSVHRLSYRVFKGEIPSGLCILHSCDNNKCIEPSHLRIGNKKENFQDALNRKMRIPKKGKEHHKSKLNESDIKEIRNLRESGLTLKNISHRFGVHLSMISYIYNKKNWSHI